MKDANLRNFSRFQKYNLTPKHFLKILLFIFSQNRHFYRAPFSFLLFLNDFAPPFVSLTLLHNRTLNAETSGFFRPSVQFLTII
ncbi:hypothetical protein Cabys_106 [Caldithrix abyssi DSM 13497]|uniref:Uncharacterized protein n=1 Tax=Caldithrix abyssi DSM 13497 TaxID=880073 RepID=A0A1J1C3I9_CALAY|nr:hypothetical protein Cabys_106 [Caldithrix abyssi DSM 13497]